MWPPLRCGVAIASQKYNSTLPTLLNAKNLAVANLTNRHVGPNRKNHDFDHGQNQERTFFQQL